MIFDLWILGALALVGIGVLLVLWATEEAPPRQVFYDEPPRFTVVERSPRLYDWEREGGDESRR